MAACVWIWTYFRAFLRTQPALAAENLALRQQLAVLERSVKRPRIRTRDRLFWVVLSRLWGGWKSVLQIVQPGTVVLWHRAGFRLFWRWKSRRGPGRPALELKTRSLIRRLSRENPLWGTPRLQSELRLLGYDVARSTIDAYRVRPRKPPSPGWKAFLKNHAPDLVSVDFFAVPTATFRTLFCFLVLSHDRRTVLHFNVTDHPTAEWTAQQIVNACMDRPVPRYLLRDRDAIYGEYFRRRVKNLGFEEVVTAPRSPWQNPYVGRLIGTIRRELLDHVIVLGERHLLKIMREYFRYYHESRCHLALDRNAPIPQEVEPPERGKIVAIPEVGGLHHRYQRVAA